MTYSAFDPRKAIRTAIKNADWYVNGKIEECISIVNNNGNPMHIPMFLAEEVAVKCPTLPYVDINLLSIVATPHNISATVRQHDCLISFDIKFNDADGIDVASFGKKVADAIVHQTRTYQCTTAGVDFMNINNQGRLHTEYDCEKVIFHWIMELSVRYTDIC